MRHEALSPSSQVCNKDDDATDTEVEDDEKEWRLGVQLMFNIFGVFVMTTDLRPRCQGTNCFRWLHRTPQDKHTSIIEMNRTCDRRSPPNWTAIFMTIKLKECQRLSSESTLPVSLPGLPSNHTPTLVGTGSLPHRMVGHHRHKNTSALRRENRGDTLRQIIGIWLDGRILAFFRGIKGSIIGSAVTVLVPHEWEEHVR